MLTIGLRLVLALMFNGYESACTAWVVIATFPRFASDEFNCIPSTLHNVNMSPAIFEK